MGHVIPFQLVVRSLSEQTLTRKFAKIPLAGGTFEVPFPRQGIFGANSNKGMSSSPKIEVLKKIFVSGFI
jgi:hypothetical protein